MKPDQYENQQKRYFEVTVREWSIDNCRDWILESLATGDVSPASTQLPSDLYGHLGRLRDARARLGTKLNSTTWRMGVERAIQCWQPQEHGYESLDDLTELAWDLADEKSFTELMRRAVRLVEIERIGCLEPEAMEASTRVRKHILWKTRALAADSVMWKPPLEDIPNEVLNDPIFSDFIRTVDFFRSEDLKQALAAGRTANNLLGVDDKPYVSRRHSSRRTTH